EGNLMSSLTKVFQSILDQVAGYSTIRTKGRSLIRAVCVVAVACISQTAIAIEENTFYGLHAGESITTGFNDSGFGWLALHLTTTGLRNTAVGAFALQAN